MKKEFIIVGSHGGQNFGGTNYEGPAALRGRKEVPPKKFQFICMKHIDRKCQPVLVGTDI